MHGMTQGLGLMRNEKDKSKQTTGSCRTSENMARIKTVSCCYDYDYFPVELTDFLKLKEKCHRHKLIFKNNLALPTTHIGSKQHSHYVFISVQSSSDIIHQLHLVPLVWGQPEMCLAFLISVKLLTSLGHFEHFNIRWNFTD